MRKGVVLLTVLAACSSGGPIPPPTPASPPVSVEPESGTASAEPARGPAARGPAARALAAGEGSRIIRAGRRIEIAPGAPVEVDEGDGIEARGRLDVALPAGDRVRFEAGAQGRLAAAGPSATRLALDAGRLLVEVAPRSGGRAFEVTTPIATAGVRGTRFVVDQGASSVWVAVLEGKVSVRPNERPERVEVVEAGRAVRVRGPADTAFVPAPIPPARAAEIERDWKTLWRPPPAETSARLLPPPPPPEPRSPPPPPPRPAAARPEAAGETRPRLRAARAPETAPAPPAQPVATTAAETAPPAPPGYRPPPTGVVDLNRAPADVLASIPALKPYAYAIVSCRLHRPFRAPTELVRAGVPPGALVELGRSVSVGDGTIDAEADRRSAAAFPKVSLRRSTDREIAVHLARVGGLPEEEAVRIAEDVQRFRMEGRSFGRVDDLLLLPSVSGVTLMRIRYLVSLN